jgi:hypothetical protein
MEWWSGGVVEGWGKVRNPKNEIRNGIEPQRHRGHRGRKAEQINVQRSTLNAQRTTFNAQRE